MHVNNRKTPAWEMSLDWRFLFTPSFVVERIVWYFRWQHKCKAGSVLSWEVFASLERIEGYIIMPRKKANANEQTTKKSKASGELLGWINVNLGDEDEPELERLASDPGKVAIGYLELVERGYDISTKWVDDGASVMACLVGQTDDDPGGRVGLSAYGSDPVSAIACLLYKYYGKLDGHLPTPAPRVQRRFR